MKYIALMLLIAFAMMLARRARPSLYLMLWLSLIVFAVTGCATERPAPTPNTGQVCAHDGAYLFLRCPQ